MLYGREIRQEKTPTNQNGSKEFFDEIISVLRIGGFVLNPDNSMQVLASR
jgi:hypothetical protein